MTYSNLLEILQIKVHQSGDIVRIFFCKEAETVMLVETCGCFIFVHLNKEQLGELRFKVSYANRALSFSSSDTGDGWDICQRKRSASLPVNTGVSLIGLAIILLLLLNCAAKIRIKIE